MISNFIRWILTLALIYGSYTETGHWTALMLLSIAIAIEIIGRRLTFKGLKSSRKNS